MSPIAQTAVYCVLIIASSLLGGMIPMVVKLTHRRMQVALSLVAGFMLGVGLMHMLAHALEMTSSVQFALNWLLAGFLVMFFIERFFCFHHHDVPVEEGADDGHEHGHDHHDHAHGSEEDAVVGDHTLSGGGAAVGLAVHSMISGIALASAVSAEAHQHDGISTFAGLAVFLVVVLHKPFDALTVITLATAGGWTKTKKHVVNVLFSLAVPAGAMLFILGFGGTIQESTDFVGGALAFSAGTFMCISMSDLLPELQFHHHDRGKLSTALIVGLLLAWVVASVEHRMHDHDHGDHGHEQEAAEVQHEDHGHDDHGHAGHVH